VVSGEQPRQAVQKASSRSSSEWSTFMKELQPDSTPRPYRIADSYSQGDFIEHPVFGVGRVLDIVGAEKMEVVFRDGRKVLLHSRGQSQRVTS